MTDRYSDATYRRVGASGLVLPAVSLGLWNNFGEDRAFQQQKQLVLQAFDSGVIHFDLANNYGPPPGAAESTLGTILRQDLRAYRDELIISTKAGYDMWSGPYGQGGSLKHLTSSLDQSLSRLGLEYVDIFYSHRRDPDVPLEETADALTRIIESGRALYVGVSNYSGRDTAAIAELLKDRGVRLSIHQVRYNLFERDVEDELFPELAKLGIAAVAFSPLAQGLLSDRYLNGVPADSRVASGQWIDSSVLTEDRLDLIRELNEIALSASRPLAQLALQWVLRTANVASAIVGVSRSSQLEDALSAARNPSLDDEVLEAIEAVLAGH